MLMSISRSQRLLAFYNDQCPVVNSTGVLWVQLTPSRVRNVLARCQHRQISVTQGIVYCLFIPLGSSLRAEAPRAERKREPSSVLKLMWAESIRAATRGLINGVTLTVQNGPKPMFFKDYSLLVVFDAYLRSKCTIPDIYTCDGAGLIVIR